jgi:hypothetical protein
VLNSFRSYAPIMFIDHSEVNKTLGLPLDCVVSGNCQFHLLSG